MAVSGISLLEGQLSVLLVPNENWSKSSIVRSCFNPHGMLWLRVSVCNSHVVPGFDCWPHLQCLADTGMLPVWWKSIGFSQFSSIQLLYLGACIYSYCRLDQFAPCYLC